MVTEPKAHPDANQELLARYSTSERMKHWVVALGYVVLFLSGLSLFHPFFFWASALFGSAALMRMIHPLVGVAFAVIFYAYALGLVRDNLWNRSDSEWVRHAFAYMRKKKELRVEGKYNAGQKLMYWSMVVVIAVLLASGLSIWRPYFAPRVSLDVRRLASVAHAGMAFVMFVGIGIHVYAAYWTRGSMRAMTRGTVSRAWARFHHAGWYEKVAGKDAP